MSNDNTIKDDESDTLTNDDLEKFSNLNNNKSKLSNKLFLTAFSIAIIFGGVFIYKYLNYQKSHVETDNAYITGHIIPVNAKIAGHISDIFVEDNQFIEKGDTLLKLEKQDLEVNINQAKAALEVAKQDLIAANSAYELQKKLSEIDVKQSQSVLIQSKSKLEQTKQSIMGSGTDLEAQKAQVNSSLTEQKANESLVNQNQGDYNRYLSLYKQGAINKQTLESSKTKLDVSKEQVKASKQKTKQLQAMLKASQEKLVGLEQSIVQGGQDVEISNGVINKAIENEKNITLKYAQLKSQEARVKQAEANLKAVQLNLGYTTIKAVASGLVSKRSVEVGQTIQANQTLLSIIPLKDKKDLWISANLKETQLEGIKKGELVEIKVDAYPNLKLKGIVDSIGAGTGSVFSLLPPDNATGNFTKVVQRISVKIYFLEWNQKLASMLRPGLSTHIDIFKGQ